MDKSVEEVLNELNITIHRKTSTNFIVRCFHPENHKNGDKNPSMSIHREKGMFHCWSCGYSGHISKVYRERTGKSVGSYKPNNPAYINYADNLEEKKMDEIVMVEGRLESVYSNDHAMEFLRSIGIYNDEVIDDFKIKFSKKSEWQSMSDTDKPITFYNRIMIPVYYDNKLINIEGRDITGKATRKVLYPRGSTSDMLFNIEKVNSSTPLIIVEGIKDLLKVYQVHQNVVSMFTSQWTERKIELLRKKGFTDNIILFIDNDEAGYQSADSFSNMWGNDFSVVHSKNYKEDPNDCSLSYIKELISNPVEYNHWAISNFSEPRTFSW